MMDRWRSRHYLAFWVEHEERRYALWGVCSTDVKDIFCSIGWAYRVGGRKVNPSRSNHSDKQT